MVSQTVGHNLTIEQQQLKGQCWLVSMAHEVIRNIAPGCLSAPALPLLHLSGPCPSHTRLRTSMSALSCDAPPPLYKQLLFRLHQFTSPGQAYCLQVSTSSPHGGSYGHLSPGFWSQPNHPLLSQGDRGTELSLCRPPEAPAAGNTSTASLHQDA